MTAQAFPLQWPVSESTQKAWKPWRYDHQKEPGAYGVCRRCGRSHSDAEDRAEDERLAALSRQASDVDRVVLT